MTIKHTPNRTSKWACSLFAFIIFSSSHVLAQEETEEDETGGQVTSIGLDPRAAKFDNIGGTKAPEPLTISTSEEEWKFEFHGFLRAPLVLSFNNVDVTDGDGNVVGDDLVVSSPGRLSDSSYIRWNYTNNMMGPWTELKFSYGNARVTGNVSIAAYNLTDAGYRNLQTQLGIDQAFISLNFPRLFGKRGGITWNVGGFSNRYGGMGRYDAGRYDTYIFGRTHIAGETLTAHIDLSPRAVLQIEHGFGAKLSVVPSYTAIGDLPEWMPYGGRVPQLPSMVNHGHLGLVIKGSKLLEQIQINGHFMHEFTNSADQSTLENSDPADDMKDASLMTMGGEIKWHGGVLGEGYVGYSHLDAKDMIRMPNGIEVLHSFEGWNLMENYFGMNSEYYGTGTIDTIAFQYTFSMASVLWHPKKFWGQGPDLLLSLFGMFNSVNRDVDDELELEDGMDYPSYAKQKFKWGGEAMYLPLSWFGMAFRYDLVQPNMANSELSMHVFSPKLLFRTNFVTHEQVTLQYTHYNYGDAVTAEFPYYGQPPDPDAIMIMASMWW